MIYEQLRETIRQELESLRAVDFPFVVAAANENMDNIIEQVLDFVINSKLEINAAIQSVENNYNPNYID